MSEGDALTNLMYHAWNKHGIKPSEIYKMTSGELQLLRAFYVIEIEKLKNAYKKGR